MVDYTTVMQDVQHRAMEMLTAFGTTASEHVSRRLADDDGQTRYGEDNEKGW